MANEKEKDQKALIILPIFLVGGGLAYYFWKRQAGAEPPPEPEEDKATLYGVVTDTVTGLPIGGVNIDCDGTEGAYSAVTASNGMYVFQNIEPGTYDVAFSKAGYESVAY